MDTKISKVLLLQALGLEINRFENKYKLNLKTPLRQLERRSTKVKLAYGAYIANINLRTLVSRLQGE